MQSKGSVLIFLAILAFPLIALSTDHNIFFGVTAALVALTSIKSIHSLLMYRGFQEHEPDEELESDLDELIGIDIRKFGEGLSVVVNMVIIVFLVYCAFFLETLPLKGIVTLAIMLRIHFIIRKTRKSGEGFDKNRHKPQIFISSISNLAVVLFTILNKLSQLSW
jgi:hypothetical protein